MLLEHENWQAGDRFWTVNGLRGVILAVAGDMVTAQAFDRPMHIRTVHVSRTWALHKVVPDTTAPMGA